MRTSGKSTWTVRIEESEDNSGRLMLGVCDSGGLHCNAWGLSLWSADRVIRCLSMGDEHGNVNDFGDVPSGYPEFDTTGRHPFRGLKADLEGRAKGSEIQFTWDANKGRLHVSINRSPSVELFFDFGHECKGRFPPHAELRPWAYLYSGAGDKVSIEGQVR